MTQQLSLWQPTSPDWWGGVGLEGMQSGQLGHLLANLVKGLVKM